MGIGTTTEKIAEVVASFQKGAALRVYMYTAVHLFVRFHGAKARTAIYLPNYWVDGMAIASAFDRARRLEGMLSDAEIARVAKNYYREITAICHNWNDLRENELWKIELRGNEVMEGLEGPIASQPTFAATKEAPASSSRLSGGATQIYLYPRSPFVCTPVDWTAI